MGLLDFLGLSPEKQIEKENKLLAKPGYTVAEIVSYNEYDREESYEDDEGQIQWRTVREAIITLRLKDGDNWVETTMGPAEGYMGYRLGDQIIVKHDGKFISKFARTLRRESPNRI